MCGIAGRVNHTALVDRGELFRMTEVMAHRGPDDHGYHLRARVGLGHRRLSIVDLAGGRQPLSNEDGSLWIVFNGEIYNHVDLRRQLTALGHRFVTRSDTEAIVHGYEQWGADGCARRLRGMFAFALWDERAQSLTLVRDRLGIKPLYYAQLGGDLVFASEIKSLLQVGELDARIDEEALATYLALRYVPAPATLFRSVHKLPPATVLSWKAGLLARATYWDLTDVPIDDARVPTDVEAALELRERIDRATEMRLMSDVPVGAFLSGGIDSTLVTTAMLRAGGRQPGPLHTFSVGYQGAGTAAEDELRFARRVAAELGTQHCELRITAEQAAERLPSIVWHLDEPVADPACVPLFFLAARAKQDVTVVLSGEGADEILAGYWIYTLMLRLERLHGATPRWLGRLAQHLPAGRWRRMARRLSLPLERSYRGIARAFDDDAIARLTGNTDGSRAADAALDPHWRASRGWSPLRRMLHLDTRVWLPDDLLVKADKMTMAHGLELRVPLLDHRLVEHAWALPDRMKLSGSVGKVLLRRAARGRVPSFVLDRPKKGFTTPTAAWLRTGMYGLARAALLDSRSLTRERFDVRYVESLLDRHRAGADLSAELWPLLVLELWHSQFVANARRLPIAPSLAEEGVHAAS